MWLINKIFLAKIFFLQKNVQLVCLFCCFFTTKQAEEKGQEVVVEAPQYSNHSGFTCEYQPK